MDAKVLFEPLVVLLGALVVLLGASWGALGRFGGAVGRSWDALGVLSGSAKLALFCGLRACFGSFGPNF